MAHRSSFPARVLAIALVILVGMALLLIAVNRLGRPAQPPAEAGETAPADTDTGPGTPAAGPLGAGDEREPAATEQPRADTPVTPAGVAGDQQMTVQLYLIDVATHELVPRYRRLPAPPTTAARAQVALEELVRTGGIDVLSPLPAETVIREVWVSDSGIAYVDLAEGFPALLEQGSMSEIHAVYGVIGTLTASFPEIRFVQFLVNEQPVDSFTGHLDLSTPLGPLSDWLYR